MTALRWQLIAFVWSIWLAAGCACNPKTASVNGATCGRQILTAVDAVAGAAARLTRQAVRSCGDAGAALRNDGKLQEANAKYSQCTAMGDTGVRVVLGIEDGSQVASDGIDAGDKAGAKDYGGLVQPVVQLARDGLKTLVDQGVNIPTWVSALLGGK